MNSMYRIKSTIFTIILIFQLCQSTQQKGKTWAFLAATSNGWINYRHQADLCHAYQLLVENGIPAENIVTMFYDDIAYNSNNKNPGVIINRPGGPNVYEGVAKDYTGQDVSTETFFNVLSGNKDAMKGKGTGRVIESGPNDNVFVYIVDHGDTGILLFPNAEYMYAHNLTQQLRLMKKNQHFKKMLMYVEACKAGSMFDNIIDDDLHVFVSTASATDEFSWARYCDTFDTCLGDYYSTIWMEHMDNIRENWSAKFTTLFKQFKNTRTNVVKSHVNIYGDFRLGYDKISNYMGDDWVAKKKSKHVTSQQTLDDITDNSVVSTKDLPVYLLKSKIMNADDENVKMSIETELDSLLKKRELIDRIFDNIFDELSKKNYGDLITNTTPELREEHFLCYEKMIDIFNSSCFNTYQNPYVTRHFFKLANLCVMEHNEDDFINALEVTCDQSHRTIIDVI